MKISNGYREKDKEEEMMELMEVGDKISSFSFKIKLFQKGKWKVDEKKEKKTIEWKW